MLARRCVGWNSEAYSADRSVRRNTLSLSRPTIFALVLAFGTPASAQTYPAKTIKMIVPLSPGSPVDASARVIAQHMQARLGQSVVVENRPGAGTTLGAKSVASAEPDGYTLLYTSNGHVFGLYEN